jgi:glycogen operon protein
MGDEVRRTQGGNNNAYCQDNEISWFDWSLLDKHAELHRFVKDLIEFRLSLNIYKDVRGVPLRRLLETAQIDWHGVKLGKPDWGHYSHSLALTVRGRRGLFHIIFNAYWESLEFELPPTTEQGLMPWQRIIDTSLDTPDDFYAMDSAPSVDTSTIDVSARSTVVLVAKNAA